MLRINLLPAYIAEKRLTRMTTIATVLCALVVVGAVLAHYISAVQAANDMEQQANDADAAARIVEDIQSAATTKLAEIQPIQAKVDFVKGVQTYNLLVPEIYRNVAKYTYRKVEYNSMNVNGDTLQVSAYVQNLADVGRFYLTLFANPDIKALSIKGIPGWPNASSQNVPLPGQGVPDPNSGGFPLAVTAQLMNPVAAPAYGGAGGAQGGGGMPSMGGMGGRPGGMPMMGAPMGGGGGSMGGSPAGGSMNGG